MTEDNSTQNEPQAAKQTNTNPRIQTPYRYYRVFDSAGTVKVTRSTYRAEQFTEQGYPVEIWLSPTRGLSTKLKALSGGTGPQHLRAPDGRLAHKEELL